MAFLIKNGVIINDGRDLIGVNTAGINTSLFVGESIQMDAQSGVVTATSFVGSGASLTDLPVGSASFVSDTVPTTRENGDPLEEGDLYYNSTVLRQFTRYDNAGDPIWVDSNPAAQAGILKVNVGVDTALVDLSLDTLIFEGTENEVSLGINTSTDTVTIGLPNDVSIGGSITANKYYGDGSALSGLTVGASSSVTSFDNQADNDYPMPFLSAVGVGSSIFTDSTTNEEFTYNPSTGILKVKEFDALSDERLKTDITDIESALVKVSNLRGVEYNWVNGSGSSVGVIAQEVQEIYPQLVNDSGLRLTVNYNGLVGLLISAVNELVVELAKLKDNK